MTENKPHIPNTEIKVFDRKGIRQRLKTLQGAPENTTQRLYVECLLEIYSELELLKKKKK